MDLYAIYMYTYVNVHQMCEIDKNETSLKLI